MNDMINDFFAIFCCHHTTKKIILQVVLCKTHKNYSLNCLLSTFCVLKEGCFEVLLTSVADFEYTYNGVLSYQVWLEFLEI